MRPAMDAFFIIIPVLIIIASFCSILWPRAMWHLHEGWKYKNVEPSDAAIMMTRVGGVVEIIICIVILISFSNMRANANLPLPFPVR